MAAYVATISCIASGLEMGVASDNSAISKFLQGELASIATAHNSIHSLLRQKGIPIGDQPRSLRVIPGDSNKQKKLVVTLSDETNDIECRVALERAPMGSKCIAPCGCTGSQQWIQFVVLNRMRRSEPTQWITCQVRSNVSSSTGCLVQKVQPERVPDALLFQLIIFIHEMNWCDALLNIFYDLQVAI